MNIESKKYVKCLDVDGRAAAVVFGDAIVQLPTSPNMFVGNAINQLAAYESTDLTPEAATKLQQGFALACRILTQQVGCPDIDEEDYPEYDPENDGECWRTVIMAVCENQPVCRVCGCTHSDGCPGGCYWVEPDLCSRCVPEHKSEG